MGNAAQKALEVLQINKGFLDPRSIQKQLRFNITATKRGWHRNMKNLGEKMTKYLQDSQLDLFCGAVASGSGTRTKPERRQDRGSLWGSGRGRGRRTAREGCSSSKERRWPLSLSSDGTLLFYFLNYR